MSIKHERMEAAGEVWQHENAEVEIDGGKYIASTAGSPESVTIAPGESVPVSYTHDESGRITAVAIGQHESAMAAVARHKGEAEIKDKEIPTPIIDAFEFWPASYVEFDTKKPGVIKASLGRILEIERAYFRVKCAKLESELAATKSELERERIRLAACGVVAMSDTPESAKRNREMRAEYRSASCDDVARRVDECIKLRAELAALERQHEADYATISKQAADLAAVSKSAAELIKAANKRADEAERDARRYRWMRSCVNDHEKMARIEAYDDPKTEVEFDAAIDEAMRNG